MRQFAGEVSKKIEKKGGEAVFNPEDSSIAIIMDGRV